MVNSNVSKKCTGGNIEHQIRGNLLSSAWGTRRIQVVEMNSITKI